MFIELANYDANGELNPRGEAMKRPQTIKWLWVMRYTKFTKKDIKDFGRQFVNQCKRRRSYLGGYYDDIENVILLTFIDVDESDYLERFTEISVHELIHWADGRIGHAKIEPTVEKVVRWLLG